MKTKKLVARLQELLDSKQRSQNRQIEALEEIVDKLERKEEHFREKLSQAESDEQRVKFAGKIAVCQAQREKGIAAINEFREE